MYEERAVGPIVVIKSNIHAHAILASWHIICWHTNVSKYLIINCK